MSESGRGASPKPAEASHPRKARVIAFYLPQFHPIPENDEWWGKGFTEWTNVARARPLFPGHYQPRLPADLGFYDLRVAETRAAQAKLAERHGIEGFCYYHYWFAGRLLLERPLLEVLNSGEPRYPFCVCWANETWSGVWHGSPERVLVEQTYPGTEDCRRHFEWMLPAFRDPRYIRVEGLPLFAVYRPDQLPNPRSMTQTWRQMARDNGLGGLHLVGMSNIPWDPTSFGFDAVVRTNMQRATFGEPRLWPRLLRKLRPLVGLPRHVYAYDLALPLLHVDEGSRTEVYPCLVHDWDSTARSGRRAVILTGASPQHFARLLARTLIDVEAKPFERRLVFLKSWNEWAEGNALEPDSRLGTSYLEVVRSLVLGK